MEPFILTKQGIDRLESMKLSLKAFRGATIPFELNLNQQDNLTIIYGENGSGKTTISDAFDLIFKQDAGSLREKSIDGKNKISSLVSNNAKASELEVTWEEGGKKIQANIKGTKPIISGNTDSILKTLRRAEVSKLIDDPPANRFKRIQNFISLPQVEAEEDNLSTFIKQQETLLESQLQSSIRVEEEITAYYEDHTAETHPRPSQEKWIKQILAYKGEVIERHKDLLNHLDDALTPLGEELKKTIQCAEDLEQTSNQEEEAKQNILSETQNSSQDYAVAHDILQKAQSFFAANSPENCPVCDSTINPAEVAGNIDDKLSQLKTLTLLSTQLKDAITEKSQASKSLLNAQQVIVDRIKRIGESYQKSCASGELKLHLLPELFSKSFEANQITPEWIEANEDSVEKAKLIEHQAHDLYSQHISLTDQQNRLTLILARKKDATDENLYLEQTIAKSKLILKALQKSRVEFANQTLASISGDFAELYKTIHPNEDLEDIRLYLNPSKKGSAVIDGNLFGKEDVSPVACLSESHLDTLGLCLFLALEKMQTPENTILYLDDAIASVDEAHLERLYQLIVDQSIHFKHVILTTHYRPLRYKYKWGILNQGKVDFIELGTWHLNTGITFAKTPASETVLLRKFIEEADDPSTIASKSGIILEHLFDFLTGIYNCKLPRNPGAEQRWTLDNYKGGLSKVLIHLRVEHLDSDESLIQELELKPLIDEIFKLLQFRNCIGCHYKELTGYFDELSEALKLGNATLALVEALCDESSRLPQHKNSGSYWANTRRNPSRKLHPLLPPS